MDSESFFAESKNKTAGILCVFQGFCSAESAEKIRCSGKNQLIEVTLSHNQLDVHHFAEVGKGFHMIAVGEDHVLAADILSKLFHGAGVGVLQ